MPNVPMGSSGALVYTFPRTKDSKGDKLFFNKVDYPVFRFPSKVIATFSLESTPQRNSHPVWIVLDGR